MANYKPLAKNIPESIINDYNGGRLTATIGTTQWNLAFIYGTALGKSINSSGTSATLVLKSGTVLGWYSNVAGSEGNAAVQTFTNSSGRYGVTVNTGAPLTVKFYAHG